ncbi:YigZ family protein [Anaerosacchariphilus polymeriproducens]|uniref:YigZ family protein n=1 Tax=Anaerosacchariphilus polymeriproducens TaxID=1812858 RepID=A0A371ASZ1_9FIRM|nr:YigZ family protein [Anaerosacchariphilus polymeriproducens]RDU22696.1 YigZ family protein [Anaerosacchariphilus polymeriproducens]
MNVIKVIYEGGQEEIVEKKSRFIATLERVETKEEAIHFINQLKKKYWDANHNCFAFVIGKQNEIQGCSDDGEPSGTAGRPMLDVLLGEEVHNTVVVVTRYFGGTLLGTGGLVRAYQKAVKEGLKDCKIIEQKEGVKILIRTDYNGIGKIQYVLGQHSIHIIHTEYTENVAVEAMIPLELLDELKITLTEVTNGKAEIILENAYMYAVLDNQIEMFDSLPEVINLLSNKKST